MCTVQCTFLAYDTHCIDTDSDTYTYALCPCTRQIAAQRTVLINTWNSDAVSVLVHPSRPQRIFACMCLDGWLVGYGG